MLRNQPFHLREDRMMRTITIESTSILSGFFKIYFVDPENFVPEKRNPISTELWFFVKIIHHFRVRRKSIWCRNEPPQFDHISKNHLGISCDFNRKFVDVKPFLIFLGSSSFRLGLLALSGRSITGCLDTSDGSLLMIYHFLCSFSQANSTP